MFYRYKWLTSDRKLKKPWIESIFSGKVPEYINHTSDGNLSKVCYDLLKVMKNNSKNLNNRISLRLTAELSNGVCHMYKNKVNHIYKDMFTIDGENCSTSDVTPFSSNELIADNLSSLADVSSNSEDQQADNVVRKQKHSSEYNQVSEDDQHATEMEVTSISLPESQPSMLLPDELQVKEKERLSLVVSPPQNTIEKPFDMYATICEDDFDSDNSMYNPELTTDKILKDTATKETVESPISRLPDLSKSKFDSLTLSPISTSGVTLRKSFIESQKSTNNVSKFLEYYYQDHYKSSSKVTVEDTSQVVTKKTVTKKGTRKLCVWDKRITISKHCMRRRLRNPKIHTHRKADVRDDQPSHMPLSSGNADKEPEVLRAEDNNMSNILDQTMYSIGEGDVSSGAKQKDATEIQSHNKENLRYLYDITEEDNINESTVRDEPVLHIDMSREISKITSVASMEQDGINRDSVEDDLISIRETIVEVHAIPSQYKSQCQSTTHVIFPMYLINKINPNHIQVMSELDVGQIRLGSDVGVEEGISQNDEFSTKMRFGKSDVLNEEWGENGVFKKLVQLWRHKRMVTPDKLFSQGSKCGNSSVAKARMFHSILCLKSKGVVKCIKGGSGLPKYLIKGRVINKLEAENMTD